MALNAAYGPLFTQGMVDAMQPSVTSVMAAEGRIYRSVRGEYDETTNTYPLTYVYNITSKMRVQPLRSATPRIIPNNTTDVQTVLVSVPISALGATDVRPGDQVRVTSAPLNPALTKYTYIIFEIMDSSNPLERTVLCRSDQEEKA
jgi:hypothetical protein